MAGGYEGGARSGAGVWQVQHGARGAVDCARKVRATTDAQRGSRTVHDGGRMHDAGRHKCPPAERGLLEHGRDADASPGQLLKSARGTQDRARRWRGPRGGRAGRRARGTEVGR